MYMVYHEKCSFATYFEKIVHYLQKIVRYDKEWMSLQRFNKKVYFTAILHLIIISLQFTRFSDEGSDCMKIEKVSDNQIRCTLTREDLAERQIKLSELAYGTEKAEASVPGYDAAGCIRIWI